MQICLMSSPILFSYRGMAFCSLATRRIITDTIIRSLKYSKEFYVDSRELWKGGENNHQDSKGNETITEGSSVGVKSLKVQGKEREYLPDPSSH